MNIDFNYAKAIGATHRMDVKGVSVYFKVMDDDSVYVMHPFSSKWDKSYAYPSELDPYKIDCSDLGEPK